MANQYTTAQAVQTPAGLAGLTVNQDLALAMKGRYGRFISKIGDQLVYGISTQGHSIESLVAVPNSPGWMIVMLDQPQRASSGGSALASTGTTTGTFARKRNRSRARPAVPA